ncbi:MAG TPA: type I pullulanase, partial [Bacillus sp. (in: firmicutes)]|nr:type I pullulanase [Bacillus sp. (in: firmicutes)]
MISIERAYFAYLDEMNVVTIIVPNVFEQNIISSFNLECVGEVNTLSIEEVIHLNGSIKYICKTLDNLDLGRQYWIKDALQRKTDLQIGAVTRTDAFDQTFYYDGDLGVQYHPEETQFKIWAPTATGVKLKLLKPNEDKQEIFNLSRIEKGVWTVSVGRNIEYYRYTYLICVNLQWKEAVDPYTVSVTANGTEGVIIDLNKTKIP